MTWSFFVRGAAEFVCVLSTNPPVHLPSVNIICAQQHYYQSKLKLALIGQSLFGQEVYTSLRKQGHKVVGVFTVPDKDGKADPLGEPSVCLSVCWALHCLSVCLLCVCCIWMPV